MASSQFMRLRKRKFENF